MAKKRLDQKAEAVSQLPLGILEDQKETGDHNAATEKVAKGKQKLSDEERRERKNAYMRDWNARNKDKKAERDRIYRDANKEKIAKLKSEYSKNLTSEQRAAINRRAVERTATLSPEKKEEIRAKRKTAWDNRTPEQIERRRINNRAWMRTWYKNRTSEERSAIAKKQATQMKSWSSEKRVRARAVFNAWAQEAWKHVTPEQRVKIYEKNKRHRDRNPDKIRAYRRRYVKENPLIIRALRHKRKALKKGVGGSYSAAEIRFLFIRQRKRCPACRARISDKRYSRFKYHVDHVMPLIRGGSNDITNIQLLCGKCNMTKHDMLPEEWARRIGRLFC